RAAERGLKSAMTAFERVQKLRNQGAVSAEQVDAAQETVEKATSELEIRKAELQEHAVRVNQAKRRLDGGDRASMPAPGGEWGPERVAPATVRPASGPRGRGPEPVRPGAEPAPARNADPTLRPVREPQPSVPARNATPEPEPRFRPPAPNYPLEDREGS